MPVPQWPYVPGNDETFGMNEKKELKKQWKSMSPKEKIGYFKDYYLLWVAGGALIAGLLFTMIWKALHPVPERQLFVYIFNDVLSDEAEKETVEAFCREYGLRPDLIEISDGHDPDADALLFATFTGDEQLDLVICREKDFAAFAGEGMFFPLEDVFTEKELKDWSNSVVSCPGLLETDSAPEDIYEYYGKGEVKDFGLRISDSETYRKLMMSDGDYVCGILGLGANTENAENFVRFMMEQ